MTPGRPHHIQLRAKKSGWRPLDIGRPLYAWKQGDHFPEHIKFSDFSSGDSNTAFNKLACLFNKYGEIVELRIH